MLTPLIAWICTACLTTRAVAPTDVRYDDRLSLESERPLMLRGTLQADRSLRFDCPLLAVSGRVLGVAGDSVWFDPIVSRTLAPGAPGECGSVDAGVLAIADTTGVAASRVEFSGTKAAVAGVVLLGLVLYAITADWGFTLEPHPRSP